MHGVCSSLLFKWRQLMSEGASPVAGVVFGRLAGENAALAASTVPQL